MMTIRKLSFAITWPFRKMSFGRLTRGTRQTTANLEGVGLAFVRCSRANPSFQEADYRPIGTDSEDNRSRSGAPMVYGISQTRSRGVGLAHRVIPLRPKRLRGGQCPPCDGPRGPRHLPTRLRWRTPRNPGRSAATLRPIDTLERFNNASKAARICCVWRGRSPR